MAVDCFGDSRRCETILVRLLENDLALYQRRCSCRGQLVTGMEHYYLRSSSISMHAVMVSLRLLTVAQLHGLLPNSQVVLPHQGISACCQQTIGVMVHSLQAGYAVVDIFEDSAGDFSQRFEIN